MARYDLIYFEIGDVSIPVKRYYERRRNVRISAGKDSILFRLPKSISVADDKKYHIWAKQWIVKQLEYSKEAVLHLLPIKYVSGSSVLCMEKTYKLNIKYIEKVTSLAKINQDSILLSINNTLNAKEETETIRRLISRVMAKKYKPEIEKRLRLINHHYFNHEVKNVRLKYNRTNWGSCSSRGNINLSTRLLLVPEWVRDYVIVHELAHMNEMNHSKKYWSIVERVYPEYEKAEKWLKFFGAKCDFIPTNN